MNLYAQNLIVDFTHWQLFLHPDQHYLGRTYAWIRRDDPMLDICDLFQKERDELFGAVVPSWKAATSFLWSPDHYNYAWLGNGIEEHEGHGHLHLIPRYRNVRQCYSLVFEDNRWGRNYAPYDPFPASPQLMRVIRDDIKQAMDITELANWAAKKITSS
jgi:diadenosine tetraphosphate (Ap4A) HIT family hydrolase